MLRDKLFLAFRILVHGRAPPSRQKGSRRIWTEAFIDFISVDGVATQTAQQVMHEVCQSTGLAIDTQVPSRFLTRDIGATRAWDGPVYSSILGAFLKDSQFT